MKTRMKLWEKYRREINGNSKLQEVVLLSNEKLKILHDRILKIIPNYDKKYKINLNSNTFYPNEILSPPEFKTNKLLEIEHQLENSIIFKNNFNAIDDIDFSSHDLDDILKDIKNKKISTKRYLFKGAEAGVFMKKSKKIELDKKMTIKPSIAIDGPSGAGKSTIAKMLAKKYDLHYINTGLVYRAIALNALDLKIDLGDEDKISESLNNLSVELLENEVVKINGIDVTAKLRSDKISQSASIIAAYAPVRKWAVKLQQSYGLKSGVIMDGRDTTFKIMPQADIKIFLETTPEERAKRRVEQNKKLGFSTDYDLILSEIKERDDRDINREIDPLHIVPEAHLIDATNLSISQVVDDISNIIYQKVGR